MEQEMKTLNCPFCGREITVPSELEEFSCLYCGERITRPAAETPAVEPVEADREYVRAHFLDCIRNEPNSLKNFTRKLYDNAFQVHLSMIEETYQAMNRYVCAQPDRRDQLLDEFVSEFLSQWESYHQQAKKGKAAREKLAFQNKITLAMYTVPAILELGLPVSEAYTSLLETRFNAAYPDNYFHVGRYSDISSGFRKRLCFLTTAVCAAEGKPDDCAELTAFRAFRDGWLSETEQGRALIAEYYELAPAIVTVMRLGDDGSARCAQLRRDYLKPCYEALQGGEKTRCRDLYIRMVNDLRGRYCL